MSQLLLLWLARYLAARAELLQLKFEAIYYQTY